MNAIQTNNNAILPAIYGRSKGAEWFEHLYKKDVMILGAGGIGSWLSLLLSRNGVNLYIYDMDRFEDHNGGQVMFRYDNNKLKTEALQATIADFSPDTMVQTFGKYTAESETGRIVLAAFDNMPSRRIAFEKWAQFVSQTPASERKYFFFQDGRLLAEQIGIFSIPGDRPDLIEKYRSNYLPNESEVKVPPCTYAQTSFMAAGIAFKMITFLVNWITNTYIDPPVRQVPFYHQYFGALNLTVEE